MANAELLAVEAMIVIATCSYASGDYTAIVERLCHSPLSLRSELKLRSDEEVNERTEWTRVEESIMSTASTLR